MNLQLAQWAHRFVCRDLKFAIENGSNRDYLAARRAVRRSRSTEATSS